MATELRDPDDLRANPALNTAIERLRDAGTRSGLFFDFDGVLSRIQDDPESVQPTVGAIQALDALSGLIGSLAIVSSRNADFLHSRLKGIHNLKIYGLYGLERAEDDGTVVVEPEAQEWLAAAQRLWSEATRALPDVYVEDKRLSVGLHYRRAPHAREAVQEWAREAAERSGFHVQPGRMAVELKPPLSIDKGSTVGKLIGELKAAWYFGDDLGDVPAFEALHRKANAERDFSGLAVGVGNDTVVEEIRAHSDLFIASPALLVELLRYVQQGLAT